MKKTLMDRRHDISTIVAGVTLIFLILLIATFLVVYVGATYGISRMFYAQVDLPGFAVVAVCALFASTIAALWSNKQVRSALSWSQTPIWVIAFVTFLIGVVGTHLIYHTYAFSMDEWMTRLQAEIFLSGQLSAIVPEEWREIGRAMYHSFAAYDEQTGRVASDYRPGMSLLYAFFDLAGFGIYSSAFMNTAAIFLVASVARQLFPENSEAPIIAAILLATSQQALAMSLTSYAMSAHLCFNLLWLDLFLRDRWRWHICAALLGVATAALHQIHFHLFFALPFLLTLLRPFRFSLIALYGGIYLTGHLGIYAWDWLSMNRFIVAETTETRNLWDRLMRIAKLPDLLALSTVAANIGRLFAWQSLALLPLLMVGIAPALRQKWPRLLGWSIILSIFPYPFVMPDQGHGWGYRYLHGLLGHLALLAIPGWIALKDKLPCFRVFVLICLLISPLALIPFRGWQIESWVRPYAEATRFASEQIADIVIVNSSRVVLGADIPRNSAVNPIRPIQLREHIVTPEKIIDLCQNGAVLYLGPEAFKPFGISSVPPELAFEPNAYGARIAALSSLECQG